MRIPDHVRDLMIRHAEESLPNEACGLLAGLKDENLPTVYIPVTNTLESPTSFRMDEIEQLNAFSRIDSEGLTLLATFHSHPIDVAVPSAVDRDMLRHYDVVHIIFSNETGKMRGWMIRDEKQEEVRI